MNIYQVFDTLKKDGTDLLGISIETGISIYDLREVARDISKNPSMEIINKISNTYNFEVQYIYGVPHFFPKEEFKDRDLDEMDSSNLNPTAEDRSEEEIKMLDYLKDNHIATLEELRKKIESTADSPDEIKTKYKVLKKIHDIKKQISDIENCLKPK